MAFPLYRFGTCSQTAEHPLQSCPIFEPLRKRIWPDHTTVARKPYGSPGDLRCTATFIEETGSFYLAKDPGFKSRLRRDFFRVESYQ